LVWVPVGTNVALVVVAAIAGERVAVALTAVGAVVVTGAVVEYLRESERAENRIAYLQATIPNLSSMDSEAARNLAPKPSAVVTEVLKHAGTTPVSLPRVPIDRP
jgi:hypothetical protein